jgi:Heparinase II/III-like protein
MTRRHLLQLAAASAVAAAPQAAAKRNLLAPLWPKDRLAQTIAPLDRFHPFATAAERPAWEALPSDARASLIHTGETQLNTPWPSLPATVFLEYQRTGNRDHYESINFARRGRLQNLVIAECAEGKGRFADEIANGVWLTCEETFWGLPAHLGPQKAGTGLPDFAEPIVDLFAAETAALLAWTSYLLNPALAGVSKLIPERIYQEIDRRLLTPCMGRDFGWMGFTGAPPNNWDPWICSNWLTAALLLDRDPQRRLASTARILECLDHFLDGYADDGGCDEGPSYWGRAAGSLFDCLDLLYTASAGALDAFRIPLIHEMGLFVCRAHVAGDWYTNFSDAPAHLDLNGSLVYRYGKHLRDARMIAHGAFAAFHRDPKALPGESIGRQLPGLFVLAEMRRAPRVEALERDVWWPGIQVMAARVNEGSAAGLYLAAEAGNNGKSHNHNDVGNFVVFADSLPAIIDVGVGTYTAQTFSSHRYEIWTMQSAWHNCPTIDGVMQKDGRRFAASEVRYLTNAAAAELHLNLAGAYPPAANLERWNRALRLNRLNNEVTIADDYSLAKPAKLITLTLMTPCPVTENGPGRLTLSVSPTTTLHVLFDAAAFHPGIEEVPIDDARLKASWGTRLYRILLKADSPPAKAQWMTRIVTAK